MFCGSSTVIAANTYAQSRLRRQSASKHGEEATVSISWRTSRRTRRGTWAGRNLIRYIKCVRLTDVIHKGSIYQSELDVKTSNPIHLTGKVSRRRLCLMLIKLLIHRLPILHLNLLKLVWALVVDKFGFIQEYLSSKPPCHRLLTKWSKGCGPFIGMLSKC